MLDANRLGHRDLHVVDVTVVPDRLEDAVAETKRQDVLNGFFAEVVVDAKRLILMQARSQLAIQRVGRVEIVAERLLDDHSAPVAARFFSQPGIGKLLDDLAEENRRDRGIEEIVALRAVSLVDLLEFRLETLTRRSVLEVARHVGDPTVEPFPQIITDLGRREFLDLPAQLLAEILGTHVDVADANDRKFVGQQIVVAQVVQRRYQQALGQITSGAEDYEDAWTGGASLRRSLCLIRHVRRASGFFLEVTA